MGAWKGGGKDPPSPPPPQTISVDIMDVFFFWQLSGLVVERRPVALKAGVQTQDGEPKNFQYGLSSAETQQPVDRMRRKARGCLVLSVLC